MYRTQNSNPAFSRCKLVARLSVQSIVRLGLSFDPSTAYIRCSLPKARDEQVRISSSSTISIVGSWVNGGPSYKPGDYVSADRVGDKFAIVGSQLRLRPPRSTISDVPWTCDMTWAEEKDLARRGCGYAIQNEARAEAAVGSSYNLASQEVPGLTALVHVRRF